MMLLLGIVALAAGLIYFVRQAHKNAMRDAMKFDELPTSPTHRDAMSLMRRQQDASRFEPDDDRALPMMLRRQAE